MRPPARGPQAWRFRPVTAVDAEALAALRVEAMRPSLELLGRFDPARARERFLARFEPCWTRWIETIDDPAGARPGELVGLVVLRPDHDDRPAAASLGAPPVRWLLDHFYLRPAWQGAGLGSAVLQALLAETDRSGQAVRVGALRGSPANGFYRRHGFQGLEETEWDLYYLRPAEVHARADDPAARPDDAASGAAVARVSPVPDDLHRP